MKKLQVLPLLLIALAAFALNAKAQAKKRIGLPEGANSVSVKGKVSGKRYALYEVWAEKGDSWSIALRSANSYIGYTVKAPDGNRYDFLEKAPVSGFYLIRVELNSKGAKAKVIASFTLDIKFEMEGGMPLGE